MSTTLEVSRAGAPPDAGYVQWRNVVEAELEGAPFDKKLVTRTAEGIAIQPLYVRASTEPWLAGDLRPGEAPYLRGYRRNGYAYRPWEFAQEIDALRAGDFNTAALAGLVAGQTALVLRLDRAGRKGLDPDRAERADIGCDGVSLADLPDFGVALEDVDLTCIPVYLEAGGSPFAAAALYLAHAKKRGCPWRELTGGIIADPLGEWAKTGTLALAPDASFDALAEWTKYAQEHAPRLATIGVDASFWADAGGDAVQELAFALAAGVAYLRALDARGVAPATAAVRMRFQFAIGPHFLTELAKFRAFRLLWSRAASAFGAPPEDAIARVHARTGHWNKTVLDAHVNLLRGTTEALSAVLGGVDSLHVAPFDEPLGTTDEFSRRIARNVHTLLAEEFGLTLPADPAGGSWCVETLTDEIARKAWALLQEIERQGGFVAALRAGYLQKLVGATATTKIEAVDKRRTVLVGTNLYPNAKDKLLRTDSKPAAGVDLVAARCAEIAGRRFQHTLPTVGDDWRALFDVALAEAHRGATLGQLSALARCGAAAEAVAPVQAQRAAAGFEAVRRAAETEEQRSGRRVRVFLAKMGSLKQHKARADFAAGFFAVGGFELLAKETFDSAERAAAAAVASGAPVAVLCSTDDTYPELAPAFVRAVKAAAPQLQVILAGYPEAQVEAYRSAGYDDFIHVRANVRATLAAVLAKIAAQSPSA